MSAEQAKEGRAPAVMIPVEIKRYGGRVIGTHSMEIDRELTMGGPRSDTETTVRKIILDETARRFPEATRIVAFENGVRKVGQFEGRQIYLIIAITED